MRYFVLFLLELGTAGAAVPTDLFNGRDLTGLELVTTPAVDVAAVCHVADGGVLAIAGKPVGYLLAPGSYQNYTLHIEYRWPVDAAKDSNSGVLVHVASGPFDRNTWPVCFQIQTKMGRAGDLLPMAGAAFAEPLSSAPGVRMPQLERLGLAAEKALGEWNSVDIVCRDGAIRVTINGVFENRVTGCDPHAGRVGLQLEGFPFEVRNVRLTPLN
jgi:hypothetical protein